MRRLLITGGAGFLGVNAADHFAGRGWRVTILDNLSRAGTEKNLEWIRRRHPRLDLVREDVRNAGALDQHLKGQDAVIHLAAQVAVTTSLEDPRTDFEVNALGSLNLLEAARRQAPDAVLLFASTNKVYGQLENHSSACREDQPLDFHSPYGCSKGAADQYFLDYARCYGLHTAVLRQSCIYGRHQYGTEDQGWVAHFVHSILGNRQLTIYGDGSQVRDLLDVRDLCQLYELLLEKAPSGDVYNVGGGPANARNLLEVISAIEELAGKQSHHTFSDWRQGDQRYYVSDISRAEQRLGWRPRIDFDAGLRELVGWAASLPRA